MQVASGSRNPLRYRRLVELVHGWFSEHPLYDARGSAHRREEVVVPRPRSRPRAADTSEEHASNAPNGCLQALPLRGKQAEWNATLEEKREEAERALAYVELYGAYAECEAIYGVDRLLELWDTLPRDDQDDFCFDPAVIDWDEYVSNIHLPSVVDHARVRTTPGGRTGESRDRPPATPGALARSTPGGLRPREHADRVERRRLVLVAGHPSPAGRRSAALRAEDPGRGPVVARARP